MSDKTSDQKPRKGGLISSNWNPRRGKDLPTRSAVGVMRRRPSQTDTSEKPETDKG